MPTFSYKGYDFEVDHTPTEGEFTQMSAYVDTLPPKQAKQSLVDQIPGIGPAGPAPKEHSTMDKVIGAGDALLSQAATLGGSLVAWPAAVLSAPIQDKSIPETFEEMMSGAYQPKTESGKEQNAWINENVTRHLMGAMPAMHEVAVKGATRGMHDSILKNVPNKTMPKPNPALEAILKEDAVKAQEVPPEALPSNKMPVGEYSKLDKQLSEAGLMPEMAKAAEDTPLPFVPELYNEQAPRLPKVKDKFQPAVTEAQRIAAEREQSLSKPLEFERTPIEPSIPEYVPQEQGLPFSVENKLATPVELGQYSKGVQQGIRDIAEISADVSKLKEDLRNKTEVGPEQQMAIQSLEHDLENARGRTSGNLEEVAQIGRDLAQLKVKNSEGTKTPLQTGPNRGRFGQGGAIDPDVFVKDFPDFVSSVIKDAAGKLKVLYHGTSKDKIFDSFKNDKRGTFLTSDPEVASMYAKDNESKGPKYDYDKGKYVEQNTADRVMPVYANIKNPYKLTTQEEQVFRTTSNYAKMQRDLRAKVESHGHDGILYPDGSIVVFDPKNIVSATSPKIGQSKFGKGQKGSIGFFGKDPFEKFAEQARKDYPQATPDQIKRAWEKQSQQASGEVAKQQQATAQGQAYQQATGLDPKITGEVWAPEKAIEIFQTVPDLQGRNLIKEQLMSSGRLQRDVLNHPAVTWIYNLTNTAVEQGRLRARQVLDDVANGVIPKIRSHTLLGGAKEMRELLKWRFENEGLGATLPDTFSAKAHQINQLLNKGDENLLAKMNEVLAKDGKKPITAIDNHMVHYWSGPYRAYVYVKTEAGGSKLGFFVSEKSMKDAQKAMDWIKKNVPNVDLEKTKDIEFVKSDIRNRTSMFDHLLNLSNEKDPVVLEALQGFKDRIEAAQSRHLSEHNRQKYRAGVQGFTGNKPWFDGARNYADAVDSIRTKYDAGYQWVAAQEIKQQMDPVLTAQKNGQISVGQALTAGQKYVDHALGKNVDMSVMTQFADYLEGISPNTFGASRRGMVELQHVASRITLPYLLALKGTQAVQAVMQVPMSTIPKMLELRQAWNGSYTNMGTALAHGSMDGLFQLANTLTGGKFEGMTRDLLKLGGKDLSDTSLAIHKFMNENDIARMSLSDTGASREGGFAKTLGNTTADLFLNAPMNLFEGPTRAWAFSTFARQAVKDGHPMEVALKIAKEQMDTMVNYNPEASAMGLANLGAVGQEAKGLHTFMINYYSQLYRYVDLAKNQKQAAPLLAYLGLTFAVGGAVGFIGADLADWLLDGVKAAARGSKLDSLELQKTSIRQWLMTNTPDVVSVGALSTATDLGLYGSFTTKVVDPERSFLENTFPKTSASLQIAKGVLNAPKLFNPNLSDKERGTIIENVSPKYLTQTLRNRYQNKDNVVYDPNADRAGLPMYKRTDKEQAISKYGFGVRSLPEVMTQEDNLQTARGQKNVTESQKAQMTKLDSLLVAGWKAGDNISEFQKQAIGKQLGHVIETWKVNPDTINSHLETLALQYGIPQDSLRKMVMMKDVNFSNVDKFKDLNDVRNRQAARQERYAR